MGQRGRDERSEPGKPGGELNMLVSDRDTRLMVVLAARLVAYDEDSSWCIVDIESRTAGFTCTCGRDIR
jgi:hypothetical protein